MLLVLLHTVVSVHRDTKVDLSQKLPPWWLVLIVPEGVIQPTGGESVEGLSQLA